MPEYRLKEKHTMLRAKIIGHISPDTLRSRTKKVRIKRKYIQKPLTHSPFRFLKGMGVIGH